MSGTVSKKQQSHLQKSIQPSQNKQEIQAAFSHVEYSGPLPPPDSLRGYEEVLPGAAERIFAASEKEQAHRMELESLMVNSEISNSERGMKYGFTLGIGGLIVAAISSLLACLFDAPAAFGVAAISSLGGLWNLAGTLAYRKWRQDK